MSLAQVQTAKSPNVNLSHQTDTPTHRVTMCKRELFEHVFCGIPPSKGMLEYLLDRIEATP